MEHELDGKAARNTGGFAGNGRLTEHASLTEGARDAACGRNPDRVDDACEQLGDDEAVPARELARRAYSLFRYLTASLCRLPAALSDDGDRTPATSHRSCEASNALECQDAIERFSRLVPGVAVVPLPEAEVCCGFGGSTSMPNQQSATGIMDRKLGCGNRAQAAILITEGPECILRPCDAKRAFGRPVEVLRLAECVARRLPGEAASGAASG